MSIKNRILILTRKNMLLYCAMLKELLTQRHFHVDTVEEEFFGPPASVLRDHYRLVISFAGYPLTLPVKIAAVCGSDAKRLLILSSEEKLPVSLLASLDMDGIVFSGEDFCELEAAITALVDKNGRYISSTLIATFSGPAAQHPLSALSPKEMVVAMTLTKGKRNFQVARELNISPKTVNTHKTRIYRKLGIENDMQLLKLAMQSGIFAEPGQVP